MQRPSVEYGAHLKIMIDGNQWCVLMGDNLQDGVAGFGNTVEEAMKDFDENFRKPLNNYPNVKVEMK